MTTINPFDRKKTTKRTPGNADAVSAGYECMTEGCDRAASWKGLCNSCYGCAKQLIDSDQTTWDELIKMGMCIPKSKPFYVAFQQKKWELEHQELEVQNEDVQRGDNEDSRGVSDL